MRTICWLILLAICYCIVPKCTCTEESVEHSQDDKEMQQIVREMMEEQRQDAANEENLAAEVTTLEPTAVPEEPTQTIPSEGTHAPDSARQPPPSPFAKPRSSLKDVDSTDSSSFKEPQRQRAYSTPAPNQGAYYATPLGEHERAAFHSSTKSPSTGLDANHDANQQNVKRPQLSDLAGKLNQKASLHQRQKRKESAERIARRKRFSISRVHAAPVERVIEAYNDPNTNLYDVLGVKRDISDAALRKAYRATALAIHPDKNPHPDAKVAFDALQEAYDSISSPAQRAEYDQQIQRSLRLRRAKQWSSRRIRKWVEDTVSNWWSSWLLFHHEITHIEGRPEKVNALQSVVLLWGKVRRAVEVAVGKVVQMAHLQWEHYTLLPTATDRLQLLHEQLWRHKALLVLGTLLWALMVHR